VWCVCVCVCVRVCVCVSLRVRRFREALHAQGGIGRTPHFHMIIKDVKPVHEAAAHDNYVLRVRAEDRLVALRLRDACRPEELGVLYTHTHINTHRQTHSSLSNALAAKRQTGDDGRDAPCFSRSS
jgi:hypothetical protein